MTKTLMMMKSRMMELNMPPTKVIMTMMMTAMVTNLLINITPNNILTITIFVVVIKVATG